MFIFLKIVVILPALSVTLYVTSYSPSTPNSILWVTSILLVTSPSILSVAVAPGSLYSVSLVFNVNGLSPNKTITGAITSGTQSSCLLTFLMFTSSTSYPFVAHHPFS